MVFIVTPNRKESETVEEDMRHKYLMLIQMMEKEGPFTALVFFVVDKSLVTATVSTVVTYLIILLQFDLC